MDFCWIAGITRWTMLVGPACVGPNAWHTRVPARAASSFNYDSRRFMAIGMPIDQCADVAEYLSVFCHVGL